MMLIYEFLHENYNEENMNVVITVRNKHIRCTI